MAAEQNKLNASVAEVVVDDQTNMKSRLLIYEALMMIS